MRCHTCSFPNPVCAADLSFSCLLKNILFEQDEADDGHVRTKLRSKFGGSRRYVTETAACLCVRSVDFPAAQLFVPILNAVACRKRSGPEGYGAGFITQSHKNRRDDLAITL
jgi:hypothetical protein